MRCLFAGGDALASDLIWRELRVLAEKKPVIASMGDVAASGRPLHIPPCPVLCTSSSDKGYLDF